VVVAQGGRGDRAGLDVLPGALQVGVRVDRPVWLLEKTDDLADGDPVELEADIAVAGGE